MRDVFLVVASANGQSIRSGLLNSSRLSAKLRKRLHTRISTGLATSTKVTAYIALRLRIVEASGDEIALYPTIAVALLDWNGGRS